MLHKAIFRNPEEKAQQMDDPSVRIPAYSPTANIITFEGEVQMKNFLVLRNFSSFLSLVLSGEPECPVS
jgi:hypothetical protein